jgi:hypothetical protein
MILWSAVQHKNMRTTAMRYAKHGNFAFRNYVSLQPTEVVNTSIVFSSVIQRRFQLVRLYSIGVR